MSPSGHHYAWYADATGYSGSDAGPQQFRIPNPEAGTWRISVQAVRSATGQAEFAVTTSGLKPQPKAPETAHAPRRSGGRTESPVPYKNARSAETAGTDPHPGSLGASTHERLP